MIKLTLSDNTDFLINEDQISHIKATDPAIIVLRNGEEIIIENSYMTAINLIAAVSHSDKNSSQ